METQIPPVKVLDSIRPDNAGTGAEVLVYSGLSVAVELFRQTNYERTIDFLNSEPGTLDESKNGKQLAMEYLLRTALKASNAHAGNHDLWADRFTQASIELYGEPDPEEAALLISHEYDELLDLQGSRNISQHHLAVILDAYRPLQRQVEGTHPEGSQLEAEKAAIAEYGQAVTSKYGPLFDMVGKSDKEEFTATDLHELFLTAVEWLRSHDDDDDWSEWAVVEVNSTSLAVDTREREIRIASRREAATPKEVRGLIAHELLVHALRGKNGYKTGDSQLAHGLPGFLDAEEGLGILAEEAISGKLPEKAYDRYVDIALALGTVDGVQKTRKEMFDISFARQLIRAQANGTFKQEEMSALVRKVWSHVDRIYRGGRGDDQGERHAIFTKDIAYYVGYKRMAQYIVDQLAAGKTALEVFGYVSQAAFDPTNPEHVTYVNGVTVAK